jgi:hypothetical protein
VSGIAGVRGGRIYGQHGDRHAPRGSDPAYTDIWQFVSSSPATAWASGHAYSRDDMVSHGNFNWAATQASTNIEPEVTSGWFAYWTFHESLFVNGENQPAFTGVPNPWPMSFRFSVGGPNIVDVDGDIDTYSHHQLDFHGDVRNIDAGEIMFYVPLEFRHQYDVPITNQHDDVGIYVPCRLLSTGEFIYGTV